MDLVSVVKDQEAAGVMGYCQVPSTKTRHCTSSPCLHDGLCHERWNRFVCDCTSTGHRGPVCMLRTSPHNTISYDKARSTPATMSNQHCRMLQCRMLLKHCCRFWQQCRSNVRLCYQKRQQCRTSFALKFRPFDKVERCFDSVASTLLL